MTSLRLPPLPTVRDLVKMYRLNAVKQLSQNFLMDERMIAKMVKKAGRLKSSHVVEVGPGPGGITRAILRKMPERVIVIEKDKRFKPFLEMLTDAFASVNGKMEVIYDDIMRVNMENLFPEEEKKSWEDHCPNIHIIGNLPFNVSTPLIIKWLHAISERRGPWSMGRTRMTLTFQKEVAERLVADVTEDQRCRLSIMAQAWTHPQLQFIIPGMSFLNTILQFKHVLFKILLGTITINSIKYYTLKNNFVARQSQGKLRDLNKKLLLFCGILLIVRRLREKKLERIIKQLNCQNQTLKTQMGGIK